MSNGARSIRSGAYQGRDDAACAMHPRILHSIINNGATFKRHASSLYGQPARRRPRRASESRSVHWQSESALFESIMISESESDRDSESSAFGGCSPAGP